MKRRPTRRRILFALLAIGIAGYLAFGTWLFITVYDFPIRVLGRVDKGMEMAGRFFAVAPDDGSILFGRNRPGHGAIVCWNPGTGAQAEVVSGPDFHADPALSPDGRLLAYTRETGKCGHIWLANRDGSHARQLTTGPSYDWNPAFAPDGHSLWFSRVPQGTQGLRGRLVVFDLRDGSIRPAGEDKRDELVSFAVGSPIGFMSEPGSRRHYDTAPPDRIVRIDPSNRLRQFIGDGSKPGASPSGRMVAFVSGPYLDEVWVMNADGTDRRRVYGSTCVKVSIGWMPGEKVLVFLEETTNGSVLSSVRLDGGGYRPLMKVPGR